jgi:[methyl-Co(III) methanol-specific corrinoid protein]:coenzyme M methyltransferase
MTGSPLPDAHHDPAKLVALCGANHEVLGYDAVTFIINYFNEPAALGCALDWGDPEHLPMYRSHPWQDRFDPRVPNGLLERPPLRTNLQAIAMAKQRYGDTIAVLGKVMGPFSLVLAMYSVEETMLGLLDDPQQITAMLHAGTEIVVESANAQFQAGADAIAIGEGGAGSAMLSPERYASLLLGVHQRVVRDIRGPVIMHMCGDITRRLESLSQLGMACFNFDWEIPPSVMKRISQGNFRIMGNVNTRDLLLAEPETIERQVFDALRAGVDFVSPGCAVSPLCPLENLKMLATARDAWYSSGHDGHSPEEKM